MGVCSTRLTYHQGPQRNAVALFFVRTENALHLLYLDESGHADDPTTKFFVLAGFSVFERTTHWVEARIAPIAERFDPDHPETVEFHGSPMRGGRQRWHKIPQKDREQAQADILSLLSAPQLNLKVFASVIEKSLLPADKILSQAFENVACQFDQHLANIYHARRDPQRGLVIFDKTSYEAKLQALSSVFKHQGHSSGKLRNFAEVPLFIDSRASRLTQMADLIAYWIFRHYESRDDRGYRLIEPYFYHFKGANCGFTSTVTDATSAALLALPKNPKPFPEPTPFIAAAKTTVTTTIVQTTVEQTTVGIDLPEENSG